jgi:hypothetical protein
MQGQRRLIFTLRGQEEIDPPLVESDGNKHHDGSMYNVAMIHQDTIFPYYRKRLQCDTSDEDDT